MEIKFDDVKTGEKVQAVSTYWRSDNYSQEDSEIVEMKETPKGRRLFRENGEPYYVGINSSVQYFRL